nr:sugar transferase [uncultured Blautia sp.]
MWKELEGKYSVHKGIYAKYVKRIIDLVVTTLGFICISPIFLIVCILVRVKLGSPIFFKQKRTGKDEKTFEMIKFRSMTDARDENGQLLPDTERFTKFGNFLRNSSLDELPELLNVIKGDMSLIGPRPLYPFYLPYYTEKESLRHSVRGGITGLAQVNGRALCKWDDRFAYDVEYVRNITFIGDMKIILSTILKVLGKSDIGIPSVTDEGGLHIVREVQRPEKLGGGTLNDKNVPKFLNPQNK